MAQLNKQTNFRIKDNLFENNLYDNTRGLEWLQTENHCHAETKLSSRPWIKESIQYSKSTNPNPYTLTYVKEERGTGLCRRGDCRRQINWSTSCEIIPMFNIKISSYLPSNKPTPVRI